MGNSRTKNSVLIIGSQGIRRIVTLLLNFINRTIFIQVLGAEYLGLNGLFTNILSILALSELGIGSAMSFYLYRPVADNDTERIKSLMQFYKQCYRFVGLAIIGIGVCLMPVLQFIVNLENDLPINIYLVYMLNVFSSASTYLFFAYKQALIIANQQQYKVESVRMIFSIVDSLMCFVVLVLSREYVAYLLTKIVVSLCSNVAVAIKVDQQYPFIKEKNYTKIKSSEWKSFFKDVGSVSVFRLGSTLFNSIDNIVISSLLGTAIVGYYSNYSMLTVQIKGLLFMITSSIAAGIGNVIVQETKEKQYEIYKQLDFYVFTIAAFCSVCLFQLLNSFIKLWVGRLGAQYVLSQSVVALIVINFYLECTSQVMNAFREGSGHFEICRNEQLIGGILNLVFSIVLGKYFGIEGIFAATVMIRFLVNRVPFLTGISQKVFGLPKYTLLLTYFTNLVKVKIVAGITWIVCRRFHMTTLLGFIVECVLCVVSVCAILVIFYFRTPEFKSAVLRFKQLLGKRGQ